MFSKHAMSENLDHQKNVLSSFLLCPGSAAVAFYFIGTIYEIYMKSVLQLHI